MTAPATPAPCEYSLDETIAQLKDWRDGGRMYPIDVAISAVHWMETLGAQATPIGPRYSPTFPETLKALNAWLMNEEPDIPTHLALDTLYWLQRMQMHRGRR